MGREEAGEGGWTFERVPTRHGSLATWCRAGRDPRTVLVVHGGPDVGSGYLRHHLPNALPDGATLLYVDLPGVGRSGREDISGITVQTMADELRDVLSTRTGPSPIVLAHSFGGLVAVELAGRGAVTMAGLILVDPDPPSRRDWDEALATLEGRRTAADRTWLARADALGWTTSVGAATEYLRVRLRPHAHHPGAADRLELDLDEAMLRGFGRLGASVRAALGAWDQTPRLPGIQAPTLIVTGSSSPYPRHSLVRMAEQIPDARLASIPRAGHFPFLEATEPFRTLVGGFLGPLGPVRS